MSQKLTISIPAELHEALTPFRDEMNISAICAAALKGEVARRAAPNHLRDAIRRLRETRPPESQTPRAAGYAFGCKWAMGEATYNEIQLVMDAKYSEGSEGPPHWLGRISNLLGRCVQIPAYRANQADFHAGFYRGVCDSWAKVKDEVEG